MVKTQLSQCLDMSSSFAAAMPFLIFLSANNEEGSSEQTELRFKAIQLSWSQFLVPVLHLNTKCRQVSIYTNGNFVIGYYRYIAVPMCLFAKYVYDLYCAFSDVIVCFCALSSRAKGACVALNPLLTAENECNQWLHSWQLRLIVSGLMCAWHAKAQNLETNIRLHGKQTHRGSTVVESRKASETAWDTHEQTWARTEQKKKTNNSYNRTHVQTHKIMVLFRKTFSDPHKPKWE